ncbi:hypothetical protein BLNAU_5501 [Blattamonas nauphoetae]|uniref:Uncharacterized protein n=1 Tax=Blattamonas nauphoetae TaxID=2049346 RepID=A0ABQ9Y6U2_9EUKA|nr:hypothetical protein BLNAU_5501 [Blattamonas nauphoetae]
MTLPTDPTHLPQYIQFTKDVTFMLTDSLSFCSNSFKIPILLLKADPPIEVDSEIIQDLLLFMKESLPTILTNISTIDTLIASLPSDASPSTPLISVDDTQMVNHEDVRRLALSSIINITVDHPWIKTKFMSANLVGRMFETVDCVSLPLSESFTLFALTKFIRSMLRQIGDDEKTRFEQNSLIRVSVFEPAKRSIIFIFRNSDKLILNEKGKTALERHLCWIHNYLTNIELQTDEHDTFFVTELVKWEVPTMIEMENEANCLFVFRSMLIRTRKWKREKPERQRSRKVVLREEGWDDAFELRVVGIEMNTNQQLKRHARRFRVELTFNSD